MSCFKQIVSFILLYIITERCQSARLGIGSRDKGSVKESLYLNSRMPIIIRYPPKADVYDETIPQNGARIIKSSHFEFDYMLGRKISFFCMAEGLPRPHITWTKDDIELTFHKYFQVHEWFLGNNTIKSKMEIDPATQKDAGYYECVADNPFAIDRRGFRTDYVLYDGQ
uniref:Immunoglobulin domain-containing protein oig-1 n=1 Tax=Cacopsylla melanoneura TaxID=428564 RepID=A0A8D8LNF5_9HEMI